MENTAYPNLQIDLQKLYNNAKNLVSFANANGINMHFNVFTFLICGLIFSLKNRLWLQNIQNKRRIVTV